MEIIFFFQARTLIIGNEVLQSFFANEARRYQFFKLRYVAVEMVNFERRFPIRTKGTLYVPVSNRSGLSFTKGTRPT